MVRCSITHCTHFEIKRNQYTKRIILNFAIPLATTVRINRLREILGFFLLRRPIQLVTGFSRQTNVAPESKHLGGIVILISYSHVNLKLNTFFPSLFKKLTRSERFPGFTLNDLLLLLRLTAPFPTLIGCNHYQ